MTFRFAQRGLFVSRKIVWLSSPLCFRCSCDVYLKPPMRRPPVKHSALALVDDCLNFFEIFRTSALVCVDGILHCVWKACHSRCRSVGPSLDLPSSSGHLQLGRQRHHENTSLRPAHTRLDREENLWIQLRALLGSGRRGS